MRLLSREAAVFHAVEDGNVSRWVAGPPFCWRAEVCSRELVKVKLSIGIRELPRFGRVDPLPPGYRRCFSKSPRLQDSINSISLSPPEDTEPGSRLEMKTMSSLGIWYMHIIVFYFLLDELLSFRRGFPSHLDASSHHPLPFPFPFPNHHLSTTSGSMSCTASTSANLNTTASRCATQTPTRHPPTPPSASW